MTGLPFWEKAPLQAAFQLSAMLMSDQRISNLVQRETKEILQVVDDAAGEDIFSATKIPRLVGIQHSSCHWSVVMVIDHLNQVNRAIMQIVDALAREITPRGEVLIEDYQPDSDPDWAVVDQFRSVSDEYCLAVAQHKTLNSFAKFNHPWFGPLNAHQWHCLAGLHMRIHRRQARKIVAVLGVA